MEHGTPNRSRPSSPEKLQQPFADWMARYVMGDAAVRTLKGQQALERLRELFDAVPSEERRALYEALLHAQFHDIKLSDEAAEALLETVVNSADTKAFFLRFLKSVRPDLHAQAIQSGGILANLLPTDIPWNVYREYVHRRREVDTREEAQAHATKESLSIAAQHIEQVRARFYASVMESSEPQKGLRNELILLDALAYGQRLNEGMNGVIVRVQLQDFPEKDRAVAIRSGMFGEVADDAAVKVLKIYREEAAKIEYRHQFLVREALTRAANRGEMVASVPEPHMVHTITLPNGALRDAYRSLTKIPTLEDRVSCISMEFIPGEDLGTYVWRHYGQALVRRAMRLDTERVTGIDDRSLADLERPSTYHLVRNTVDDLQRRIGVLSETRHLLLESALPARNDAEQIKVRQASDRNVKRMTRLLQSDGFRIDPKLYTTIEATIDACRRAQIVLLDCHERNIMLTPDGRVFFIDFEKVKLASRPITGDDDQEAFYDMEMNPAGLPVDKTVLSFLRPFVVTKN